MTKIYPTFWCQCELPLPSLKVTGLWESYNLCNYSVVKWHEAVWTFTIVSYVMEVTAKKCYTYNKCGSYEHLLCFFHLVFSLRDKQYLAHKGTWQWSEPQVSHMLHGRKGNINYYFDGGEQLLTYSIYLLKPLTVKEGRATSFRKCYVLNLENSNLTATPANTIAWAADTCLESRCAKPCMFYFMIKICT